MRALLSVVAALLLTSCGGDATAPDHSGTYALISLNGRPLPFLLAESQTGRVELTRGEIVLRNDNTFDDVLEITATEGETATSDEIVATGSWELSGTTFTMTYDANGGVIDGELENGRITQQVGTLLFIYAK